MSPTCSRYIESIILIYQIYPPNRPAVLGATQKKWWIIAFRNHFRVTFPYFSINGLSKSVKNCTLLFLRLRSAQAWPKPDKSRTFQWTRVEALRGERIMGIMGVHHVHPATSKLTLGQVSNWGHILNVDPADVSSRFLCGCIAHEHGES